LFSRAEDENPWLAAEYFFLKIVAFISTVKCRRSESV
jgi:hypothetical protein